MQPEKREENLIFRRCSVGSELEKQGFRKQLPIVPQAFGAGLDVIAGPAVAWSALRRPAAARGVAGNDDL